MRQGKLKILMYVSLILLSAALILKEQALFAGLYDMMQEEVTGDVEMLVGEVESVSVSSPTRVSVADPAVADVDNVSPDEVLIAGKGAGTTTLSIWDKSGERSITIRVFAEDLERLSHRVARLLSNFKTEGLTIKINREEGKVVILGNIDEKDSDKIADVLEPFSDRIINLINVKEERALVQIDVQILEMTKTAVEELGISWLQSIQVREEPYSSTTTATSGVTTTLDKTFPEFDQMFRLVEWSRDALTAKLNLLEQEGKVKTLSRPKLVCLSGKEAEFVVGGEVPIITATVGTTGTSENVEYREYGVILRIKPVVRGDKVDTTIETEVSDIDLAHAVTTSTGTIPAFTTRSASTQLYLKNGQTVFLAGLIKNKDDQTVNRVPFLGRIPILGALFRDKSFSGEDTELVVSITPSIISEHVKEDASISEEISYSEPEERGSLVSTTNESALTRFYRLPKPLISYIRDVQTEIAENIHYPEAAKHTGWQGQLTLSLNILPDGSLSDAGIKESSGYVLFDQAALQAAKLQAPYPPFPAGVDIQELSVDVPIIYNTQ